MGRVEITACADKIEALVAAGHNVRSVYEELKKQGLITLSYSGFYEALKYRVTRKLRRSGHAIKAKISGRAAPPPLNLGSSISPKSSDELMDEFRVLNESREQERAKWRGTTGPKLERSALSDIDKNFAGDE